ncbi:hypothetical protein [Devriesea agamarum]|uniref:hypothetical protein n=1 Tax=Devriesea agamarum TaxID=472569 RepID=UPI00071D5DD1|nr:hypothetical protein [Devriesea agamarum]
MAQFRRPASLSPAKQDQLPGDPDPADLTDVAHASAQALLSSVRQEAADDEVVRRVIHLVQREGLEDIAALWSHAPADTLPGTLWRLYTLHTWVARDPSDVVQRYEAGARTAPGLRYLAGVEEPLDIDRIRVTLDEIMRGVFAGDLALALHRASALLTLVAFGTAHLADQDEPFQFPNKSDTSQPVGDDLGEQLTLQAHRLLTTAEELDHAAVLERNGKLV